MSIEEKLHRARAYPYDSPRFSYLYHDGEQKPFDPDMTKGRIPVLAFGSNRAPSQLYRKFGHLTDQYIPIEQIKLHGFDVVYSAHITSYGAIPAMVMPAPDTILDTAISWLTDDQLQLMHKTELYAGNYTYGYLKQAYVKRSDAASIPRLHAYMGDKGHLCLSDECRAPIAISSINTENRCYPHKTCQAMLQHIHTSFEFVEDEKEFILKLISDNDFRFEVSQKLPVQHLKTNEYYIKLI